MVFGFWEKIRAKIRCGEKCENKKKKMWAVVDEIATPAKGRLAMTEEDGGIVGREKEKYKDVGDRV